MSNQQEKIKGLVVLLKVGDKIHECLLTDLVKKEIFKLIDGYGITLCEQDLSETIKF